MDDGKAKEKLQIGALTLNSTGRSTDYGWRAKKISAAATQ
jgi:hypothetical protein